MLSFPTIFLLIIMASYVKASIGGIMLIIGPTSWMSVTRLVRGEFLSSLTVLAFNFVGDGLRDALDPKLKRA